MKTKTVIIGGVAGGATAAARLRRLDESAEIILFEKGQYISFANCGLPYYIGEVIKEKDKLLVQTPEKMKERFNIDVRVNSEVIRIDTEQKLVEVRNLLENTIYTEKYDKLVLSPGAEPIRPDIAGISSSRVFTLRNIPDTFAIKDYVDSKKPKTAVVVGAGFIGLEVAENLHKRGIAVTVVELADHVIGPLDYDMAAIVHQHLRAKKVNLILGDGVKSLEHDETSTNVHLASGRTFTTDMVVIGIGVKPETKLAKDAGLTIGSTGGILVDEYLRTSSPDIYAVGDAIEIKDFVTGSSALIPLAGPANKQGRIAADNICGRNEKYLGTQGTSIVKVFDLTIALTGVNERILKKNGLKHERSYTHSASHAGYYPGAIPMSIKILFEGEGGRLLGAQIVGYDGVDKRIDVLATALRAGMTVHDIEKLELAYAPPYSSAKDPVNIAGYTAANIIKGDSAVFHWDEIEKFDKSDSVLVDVRTAMEFGMASIAGSLNIPVDELRNRIMELPKNKEILVFCQVGLRGYIATRILKQMGFGRVRNLSGGFKTYQMAIEKHGNETFFQNDKITKDNEIKPVDVKGKCTESDVCVDVDACGLQCPGPIMQVFNAIKSMNLGEVLRVKATDPAFSEDIKAWCTTTGNKLLGVDFKENAFIAYVKKENFMTGIETSAKHKNDKTMIVFSNDLDKAIASFIIANGALALGRKVTMFFTFWGINILRKTETVSVKKAIISRMFGFMMPKGSRALSLSQMNMCGMGSWLIKYLMKKKNISSLEELIEQAVKNGVNLVACNMSMDLMGIKFEELIDGVKIGGVATFIGAAEESDMSLFI